VLVRGAVRSRLDGRGGQRATAAHTRHEWLAARNGRGQSRDHGRHHREQQPDSIGVMARQPGQRPQHRIRRVRVAVLALQDLDQSPAAQLGAPARDRPSGGQRSSPGARSGWVTGNPAMTYQGQTAPAHRAGQRRYDAVRQRAPPWLCSGVGAVPHATQGRSGPRNVADTPRAFGHMPRARSPPRSLIRVVRRLAAHIEGQRSTA
jgi:hypothetical protein